jgi:hypothetical protein
MNRLLHRAAAALGTTALVAIGTVVAAGPAAAASYTATVNKGSCNQTRPVVTVKVDAPGSKGTSVGYSTTRDPDTWDQRLHAVKDGTYKMTLPTVPAGYTEKIDVVFQYDPQGAKRDTVVTGLSFTVPASCSNLKVLQNMPTPTSAGTLKVGSTLRAQTPAWDDYSGVWYSYQWQRGGATRHIAGATKASYTLGPKDRGLKMRVIVTAHKTGYSLMRRTSDWTSTRVQFGTFTTAPTPSISGTPQAGKTLTAWAGNWAPKPSKFTYQWYRAGNKVAGATSRFYKVTAKDKGRTIKVKVTAVRSGFLSRSMTSKPVVGR